VFLSQQNVGKNSDKNIIQTEAPPVSNTPQAQAAAPTPAVSQLVSKPLEVQSKPVQDSAQESEKQKPDVDKQKQDAAAREAAMQAEKKKQEAAKALELKQQAELAKAEKDKQQAIALAQQKQQQETAKAEQARQQEIANRLSKADALREQGSLVSPEDNNAMMAYRSVLELDSNNAKATQALKDVENSYLMGIRYLIEGGKTDEATAKLREANKVFPNSVAVGELLALQQKKVAEIAAAKAEASSPKVTRIVVNDAAFESMQLAQKTNLPIARAAYVGFSYQNFEGATSLLQAVLYDSARTVKITQKPVVVTGAQGNVFFTLARPVEGFPDGGYTLDLMLNDQKLVTVVFTVAH